MTCINTYINIMMERQSWDVKNHLSDYGLAGRGFPKN